MGIMALDLHEDEMGRKKRAVVPPVSEVQQKVLNQAFTQLYVLTPSQVCKLMYSAGSLRRVEKTMTELVTLGILRRFKLPTSEGKRPFLYTLTELGVMYLEGCGFDREDIYFLPEGETERNFEKMTHLIELNDFFILAMLFAKRSEYVVSLDIQHDMIFQRKPIISLDGEGKEVRIEPDGFLDFMVKLPNRDEIRVPVWIELDRGNHSINAYRRKYRNIKLAGKNGALKARFGTDDITYSYVTTTGVSRVNALRLWTRYELKEVGPFSRPNRAFKFISLPDYRTQTVEWLRDFDVNRLFADNMWSVAYGDDNLRFALIEDIAVMKMNDDKVSDNSDGGLNSNIVDISDRKHRDRFA